MIEMNDIETILAYVDKSQDKNISTLVNFAQCGKDSVPLFTKFRKKYIDNNKSFQFYTCNINDSVSKYTDETLER